MASCHRLCLEARLSCIAVEMMTFMVSMILEGGKGKVYQLLTKYYNPVGMINISPAILIVVMTV